MSKIRRALISVSDKTGIVELSILLHCKEIQIISTGGTGEAIRSSGIPVTAAEDITGFPEMMEGRVKTLHPAIHGALLADRSKPSHMAELAAQGIMPIDLVIVNLYPFSTAVANPVCTLEHAIENIDIGGPSMIRSAAKNHASVTVVVDPDDYLETASQIRDDGQTTPEFRRYLAHKAFEHTYLYDSAIAMYFVWKYEEEIRQYRKSRR